MMVYPAATLAKVHPRSLKLGPRKPRDTDPLTRSWFTGSHATPSVGERLPSHCEFQVYRAPAFTSTWPRRSASWA